VRKKKEFVKKIVTKTLSFFQISNWPIWTSLLTHRHQVADFSSNGIRYGTGAREELTRVAKRLEDRDNFARKSEV
jgi:hypothetical protein